MNYTVFQFQIQVFKIKMWTTYQLFIALGMVVFGSINTLSTKLVVYIFFYNHLLTCQMFCSTKVLRFNIHSSNSNINN